MATPPKAAPTSAVRAPNIRAGGPESTSGEAGITPARAVTTNQIPASMTRQPTSPSARAIHALIRRFYLVPTMSNDAETLPVDERAGVRRRFAKPGARTCGEPPRSDEGGIEVGFAIDFSPRLSRRRASLTLEEPWGKRTVETPRALSSGRVRSQRLYEATSRSHRIESALLSTRDPLGVRRDGRALLPFLKQATKSR